MVSWPTFQDCSEKSLKKGKSDVSPWIHYKKGTLTLTQKPQGEILRGFFFLKRDPQGFPTWIKTSKMCPREVTAQKVRENKSAMRVPGYWIGGYTLTF